MRSQYDDMGDHDARIQDYLDDKFQAVSDFETLDSLLESVRAHQDILKSQLDEARQAQRQTQAASEQHASSLQEEVTSFQKEQGDIDRSLMIITQSETSDEAVRRFRGVMETLRNFDIALGYVEMLQEVDRLSSKSTSLVHEDVESSLELYKQLQRLSRGLLPLQEAAEGAAPHLIDHVRCTTHRARISIQDSLSARFKKTLKKMGWPRTDASVPPGLQEEWRTNVGRLLYFQQSDLLELEETNRTRASKEEPVVLLPVEVMVHPLGLRFQYHFSGDRLTNRLDKPEYFFSHILDLLNDYSSFFQKELQPLLLRQFRDSDLAFTPAYIDATSAFITALLPLLRRKLMSILPEVSRQPNLFSNLIHEVMAFDTTLLDEWNYAPLSPTTPFRGLAHYILSEQSYFPAWLAVERDFALSRYESIISDRSTGLLDYDSVEASATKPTKAAISVNDLLETITDRYRPLSSFSQKMQFLIDIQIAIFDRFHVRLHEGLEAYLTRTSTVARTVHGISREDAAELSGVKGLDRLCRVYGSARYLERAMSDWSEDVFFLDLWEELQNRYQHPESIKGELIMRDIVAKTSSTIVDATEDDTGEIHGALFDETAGSYHRLRVRSENIIVENITYDIRNALRPYARVNTWASMSTSGAGIEASLTAELDGCVRLLDEYFGYLSNALGNALRRISRPLGHSIQNFMWDSILLPHSFSTAGAAQLAADARGIWRVIDRHVGSGQGRASMMRLAEGLLLLGLPVRGEIPVEVVQDGEQNGQDVKKWGLWEVEKRLFASNESAREVLGELGLEVISEHDAREVLKKRVEISS